MARYPVCAACLSDFSPIQSDYSCRACQTPYVTPNPLDANGLCGICRRGMRGFDRVHTLGFYEGRLRKLIHIFKYGGVPTLASPLAKHLTRAIPAGIAFDLIVPVPMHWWRRYNRGYNQAHLLAREVARSTGIPCVSAAKRSRRTPPQASLSNHERSRSLKDAFRVARRSLVQGRNVLLIDDVFTTGATASGCGSALKRAGAATVTVLTLARVDRRVSLPASRTVVKSTTAGGS